MKARLAKLDQLARRINAEYQEQREGTDVLLSQIARCLLHHNPDLRLVRPEDTDAGTFADIQSTLAYARDEWGAARAWKTKVPPEPRLPRQPGEPDRVYYGRVIAGIAAGSDGHVDMQQRAVGRARKRMGNLAQAKENAAVR